MLNISSTTAVSWPTPTSTAVAPVSPIAAVQPVQASGNDGKAQTGFGRERHAAAQQVLADRAGDGRAPSSSDASPAAASGAPAAQDALAERQARQEADKIAEQRDTKDKKAVEHLQQMLSNMWEASAAVVERALGIEPSNSLPGNQSDTAPDLSAVAAATIVRKPLPQLPERAAKPVLDTPTWPDAPASIEGDGVVVDLPVPMASEVVAYDENGNSSLAPLEAGSVIDLRV